MVELRAWGMNVARRRGLARARVAVARKLGVILYRIDAMASTSASARIPPHPPPEANRKET